MVSILPGESNWDLIGQSIGKNVSQNLPGAIQQGYNRQLGMNALDKAASDIEGQNDPFKIALAFARAGAQNPSLERALGPLMQTAIQNAQTKGIYGEGPQGQPTQATPSQKPNEEGIEPRPTAYNTRTPQEIQNEARRRALLRPNDPQAYDNALSQLNNENKIAQDYRQGLEDYAIRANVPRQDLSEFMKIGEQYPSQNPDQWFRETYPKYLEYKNAKNALANAFIPGVGNGLLGVDRDKALKNLEKPVQDQVKAGFGQETRQFLADNFLSPTEIAELIHPIQKKQEAAISKLPQGLFPQENTKNLTDIEIVKGQPKRKSSSLISYDEAIEKAPKELAKMQNQLSDFFMNNVDENTSFLTLRDKLIQKDYDWRQIGPAIREAESRGLELSPEQTAEMGEIETQAPRQSLPEIFQSWGRFTSFLRGNK